jgi:hypothetical protein
MAGIERRISDLEQHFGEGGGGGGEDERLRKKFMHTALDAMASIKRAPISEPPWKYEVAKLHEKSPFDVAAYVAALSGLDHEDEDEARGILAKKLEEQDIDAAHFERLTNLMVAMFAEAKRRREDRRAESR